MTEWTFKWFKKSDFQCRCKCGYDDIDLTLVRHLENMRESMGMPFDIVSGCRCERHNKNIGGEKNSAHTRGKATDIRMAGSTFRYVFLTMALRIFKRIGVYKSFCHVDVDETLPQPVIWVGK